MGNGTKVALVALLILMMVVIAKFVRDSEEDPAQAPLSRAAAPTGAAATPQGSAGTGVSPALARTGPARPGGEASRLSGNVPGGGPKATSGSPGEPVGAGSRTIGPRSGPATPPGASGSSPSELANAGVIGGARTPGVAAIPPRGGTSPRPMEKTVSETSAVGIVSGEILGPQPSPLPRVSTLQGDPSPPEAPRAIQDPGAGGSSSSPLAPRPLDRNGNPQTGPLVTSELDPALRGGPPRPPPPPSEVPDARADDVRSEPGKPDASRDGSRGSGGVSPAPPSGGDGYPRTHTVAKGEGFWTIAQTIYGRGELWPQIQKANPKAITLRPGDILVIPAPVLPPSSVAKDASKGGPEKTLPGKASETKKDDRSKSDVATADGSRKYLVQKGDTLSGIALVFYRSSSEACIELLRKANAHLKYSYLRAGETILIPPKE